MIGLNLPPQTIDDLPKVIPIFPLGGAVLFPRGQLPLNIFEPRYLMMIDNAIAGHRSIAMIQPRPEEHGAERPLTYRTGCLGRITQFSETGDGRYLITLTGLTRFNVAEELIVTTPYRQVRPDYQPFGGDLNEPLGDEGFDRPRFEEALKHYLDANDLSADWEAVEGAPAEPLVNALAAMCPFSDGEKQAILEAPTLTDRAAILMTILEMSSAGESPEGKPN